jgi:prepilin-type N-terminal cleavage/methylation domain-containing protein
MRKARGFTLIEMLIVIAVIGVLAVAVLSAINPIEQMRKARDTRRRSNAAELLNALERYYATNEEYPTDYTGGACDGLSCTATDCPIATNHLAELVISNELKAEFSDRVAQAGNELYGAIDYDGGTDLATVCYEIEAKSNLDKYTGEANFCSGTANFVCLPE